MHEACAEAWAGTHDDSHLADATGFPQGRVRGGSFQTRRPIVVAGLSQASLQLYRTVGVRFTIYMLPHLCNGPVVISQQSCMPIRQACSERMFLYQVHVLYSLSVFRTHVAVPSEQRVRSRLFKEQVVISHQQSGTYLFVECVQNACAVPSTKRAAGAFRVFFFRGPSCFFILIYNRSLCLIVVLLII